jgi:phosphate transport system substrate-binding protein
VAGDRGSLGYFGYAYYVENKNKLKLIGVDSGAGCVQPSEETVEKGTYAPLSRPLYVYVNTGSLMAEPPVRDFTDFLIKNAAKLAAEVGYIKLPDRYYQSDKQKLDLVK